MTLRLSAWASIWLVALIGSAAQAQSSDAPRYAFLDRMFVKPKLPLPVVSERAQVELLIYHAYPVPLHHLRVVADNELVTVRSNEFAELKPTIIEALRLDVQLKRKPKTDHVRVELSFLADELEAQDTVSLDLPLTEAAAERLNAEAALPVGVIEVKVTPLSTMEFYAYLTLTLAVVALVVWRRRRAGW